jgi:hypothetical protein
MALILGEVRRLHTKFAFTVQLDAQAKPLEVVCDTKAIACQRIDALKRAECARVEVLRWPLIS